MKRNVLLGAALVLALSVYATEYNPGWWKEVVFALTPTNDLAQAEAILRQQRETVWYLDGVRYRAADATATTNLCQMLAVLHGDLREKRIEDVPPVFRNFGIITNKVELQQRRAANQAAIQVRSYQCVRGMLERQVEVTLAVIAKSEALASFPVPERNAIVSNLVEQARFTPEEAASIGLTNFVETVTGE